jgi:hypothetical protein
MIKPDISTITSNIFFRGFKGVKSQIVFVSGRIKVGPYTTSVSGRIKVGPYTRSDLRDYRDYLINSKKTKQIFIHPCPSIKFKISPWNLSLYKIINFAFLTIAQKNYPTGFNLPLTNRINLYLNRSIGSTVTGD